MKKIILLFFLVTGAMFYSCRQEVNHDHAVQGKHEKYTCPMHPQIVSDKKGTCPICKMDLVLVTASASSQIRLSDNQVKLANIRTAKVTQEFVGHRHIANGRLTADETGAAQISVRVAGRLDKVYVKETGTTVKKGDPLYELFSEQLQALQQEYLLALEQYEVLGKTELRYKSMAESAEKKLTLYGVSTKQLGELKRSRKVAQGTTFYAPASGYIAQINVSEGQYVQEGMTLFEVQDNSTLWVEAEIYPGETSLIKLGDKVQVRVSGFEPTTEEATVSFFSPELQTNTQINMMRAELKNAAGKYKPGMQVQVVFTSSQRMAMAVPLDAIIRDGKGAHLFVKTGNNTFEPRPVKTGSENIDVAEVTEGLKEGEEIVTSGAYLLYSEIVLKKGGEGINHVH
jgi:membrane fusion protein, copper/silver efflux system